MEKEKKPDDSGGITIVGAPMGPDDATGQPPQSPAEPSIDEAGGGCIAIVGYPASESEASRRERRIAGFFLRNLEWISEKAKDGSGDCWLSFDERDDHGAVEIDRSGKAGVARPKRFVQFCFSATNFVMDLPNSTLAVAEAKAILHDRPQFFFVNARRKSKDPNASMAEHDPLQREYVSGEERLAAEDMAYILFDVWKFPVDVPLDVKAGRF